MKMAGNDRRKQIVLALVLSMGINFLAYVATEGTHTPSFLENGFGLLLELVFLFWLVPGEIASMFVGGNMISGPVWLWAVCNMVMDGIVFSFLLSSRSSKVPLKGRVE